MFVVVCKLPREFYSQYNTNNYTLHVENSRKSRIALYGDITNIVDGFIVDKGHPNGNEVHLINENGVIYIFNHRSQLFISALNARPNQIKRYYADGSRMSNSVRQAMYTARMNNLMNHYNER